jgi:hypothetical protein
VHCSHVNLRQGLGIIDALATKDVVRQRNKVIAFNRADVWRSQDHVVTVSSLHQLPKARL